MNSKNIGTSEDNIGVNEKIKKNILSIQTPYKQNFKDKIMNILKRSVKSNNDEEVFFRVINEKHKGKIMDSFFDEPFTKEPKKHGDIFSIEKESYILFYCDEFFQYGGYPCSYAEDWYFYDINTKRIARVHPYNKYYINGKKGTNIYN